jgi:hypothetical protein
LSSVFLFYTATDQSHLHCRQALQILFPACVLWIGKHQIKTSTNARPNWLVLHTSERVGPPIHSFDLSFTSDGASLCPLGATIRATARLARIERLSLAHPPATVVTSKNKSRDTLPYTSTWCTIAPLVASVSSLPLSYPSLQSKLRHPPIRRDI